MTSAADIIDALDETAAGQEAVSVCEIEEKMGTRSKGVFIALPALLELTPVGGVPGVPTLLAVIVALFAVQIAMGRSSLWLPGLIEGRTVSADKLDRAVDVLRGPADWIDRHFGKRLTGLVDGTATRIAAGAVLILTLTVPPLELVPFASSLPMATIALFGLAMLLRDGLAMAVAWVAFFGALYGVWAFLT